MKGDLLSFVVDTSKRRDENFGKFLSSDENYLDESMTVCRDVHVIEVLRASSWPTAEPSDVVLNLCPRSRRPPLTKHLVLILKSHMPVRWIISTQSLRGVLDIIVCISAL